MYPYSDAIKLGRPSLYFLLSMVVFLFLIHTHADSQDLLTSDQIEQMLEKAQPVPPLNTTGKPLPRTRGITSSAAMPKTQVEGTVSSSNAVVFNDALIRFDTSSAQPTNDSLDQLKELAEAFQSPKFKGNSFMLVGHTDSRGSTSFNRSLSERRARAVKQFIISHSTVKPSRIQTAGRGEDEPLDEANTKAAWRKNRRVEISLLRMAEARILFRKAGEKTERQLETGQALKSEDELAFHFNAFDDCYFYIFTVDTAMDVSMIFPQAGSGASNFLRSGQSARLPGDRTRWFSLDSNIGPENVYLCATRKPADTATLLAEIRKAHQSGDEPAARAITGVAETQQIVDEERRNLWQLKYDYVKHIMFKHE